MTGPEAIAYVERQVRFCQKTDQRHIDCPYCGKRNDSTSEVLCCSLLGQAVEAVLDVLDDEQRLDEAKRILHNEMDQRAKSGIIQ